MHKRTIFFRIQEIFRKAYFNLKYCFLQLAGVDVVAALDMFVDRGEWEKCLQTAEQQVLFISYAYHNTLSK